MIDQLDVRKFLRGRPRPYPGEIFGDKNADVRSVCGS